MKNLLTLLIITSLLISSCAKNEKEDTAILDGEWHLIDVSCFCNPTDFKMGEHIWNFNMSNNIVTISNSISADLQMYEDGAYTFSTNNSNVTIKSTIYDFEFKNNKLYISDHPEVDGPLMVFVRAD